MPFSGRRDDIHNTFGSKRLKLDYGNQNRVSSGKDPFSFETDPDNKPDASPAVVQPKKFFKSRNVPPVVEESRQDVAIYRQVPDSQYGRARAPKQPPSQYAQKQQQQAVTKTSHATISKKVIENLDSTNASADISNREESKPPIVLRICKGTARLVCGDVQQDAQEPETDTYRISTPLASPSKVDVERKITNTETSLKSDHRSLRAHQPVVSTVSIPLENSEMRRTTRSRAKNLHLDLSAATTSVVAPSTTPVTPNSHGSGLSLTLRKSVTDSNNTLISHYDIVKTDCSSTYSSKPTIEPLIGRDQPLPTTTQELIDILSSDSDTRPPPAPPSPSPPPHSSSPPSVVNVGNTENVTKITEPESVANQVQHCSDRDVPTNEITAEPVAVAQQPEPEPETEPDLESEPEPLTRGTIDAPTEITVAAAKTLVDQDWFSGSDDSEGAGGNTESEIPLHVTNTVSESQVSDPPSTSVPSTKPAATKKGSIFKSRSTGATNGNKRRALYKHKWCDSDKESTATDAPNTGNSTPITASGSSSTGPVTYEEEFDPSQLTRVVTYPSVDADFEDEADAITSIRCGKKVKGVSALIIIQ